MRPLRVYALLALALSLSACSAKQGAHATNSPVQSTQNATFADASAGKQIFGTNCAACHGAAGQGGGIGPSLRDEKSRKTIAQTQAWIKNPEPPMPKLYPGKISEKDVRDIAAYVQSL